MTKHEQRMEILLAQIGYALVELGRITNVMTDNYTTIMERGDRSHNLDTCVRKINDVLEHTYSEETND